MLKPNYYDRSLANVAKNNLISLVTATLILLITFNVGWLLILVNISSRLALVKNLGKTILNLELLLFLGNLGIIMLSLGFIWEFKRLSRLKNNCH